MARFNPPVYPPRLSWDVDFETLAIDLGDGVVLQTGQEHLVRVKNFSGDTAIPDGKVVMFAGATGDTVAVSPAVSDGSVNNEYLLGITTEEIPADGFGFVTQFGFINQVKTDYVGWSLGTLLYADPASPGDLTHIEPAAPAWHKPIAAVTRVQENSGRIFVRASSGETLNELHNVSSVSPNNGDVLVYNSSTEVWENAPQSGGGSTGIDPFLLSGM